jgi:hypothetical protein
MDCAKIARPCVNARRAAGELHAWATLSQRHAPHHAPRFPDVIGFVLGSMSRWPRRVLDGFGYVRVCGRVSHHPLAAQAVRNQYSPTRFREERRRAQRILAESTVTSAACLAESLWAGSATRGRARKPRQDQGTAPEAHCPLFTSQRQSYVLLAAPHFLHTGSWLPLSLPG